MVTDAPPMDAYPSVTSSARIEARSQSAPFTPAPKPSGSGSEVLPEEPSAKPSGSGYELPELRNVQWEFNKFGGWEAWHVPDGVTHRRDKAYLGYLGKRQIAAWERETPERFQALVVDWISEKRKAKGI